LSEETGVKVEVRETLAELDFGKWTGEKWTEFREEELWRRWNAHRSGTRMPGGETMLEVQARVVGEMMRIREERGGERVAVVSHGDVIKAAVAYVLGAPLDLMLRIEILLASVTVVEWGEYGPWVLGVNFTGEIEMPYAH
jgi:broad specificity phosphatase PhoE